MKAAAFSLVVLTLNVAGPRRRASIPRLKAEGADVAAFQEVRRKTDLEALGEAAGHAHHALDERLGLAVTSRLPIDSWASRDLGGGYGVLRARLRGEKGAIDVYSTRLEPGDGLAAARRLGQMFRMAEFIRTESSGRPFVLLGDFGVDAAERDSALLLDLLEGRDLCVSHGDEACNRPFGDRRVDYAVIPYSSRPPRETPRVGFADLPRTGDGAPHFGLRVVLDEDFFRLKPAIQPPGRDEALATIGDSLEDAATAAARNGAKAGWIPFLGARQSAAAQDEVAEFASLEEEIRTTRLRASKRELPSSDD